MLDRLLKVFYITTAGLCLVIGIFLILIIQILAFPIWIITGKFIAPDIMDNKHLSKIAIYIDKQT